MIQIINTVVNFPLLDVTGSIRGYLVWFLGVAGGLMALIGIIQFAMAGRAGDGQGKTEAAWLIGGGLAIAATGVLVNVIVSAPPSGILLSGFILTLLTL